jgi:hypothetical protein
MMLYSRLTAALLCGAVLLSLAACSDPGGVGANVGREPLAGGTPSEDSVFASPTSDTTEVSVTGLDGQGERWRFLVGRVSDDLNGRLSGALDIKADGYLDIGGTDGSNPFSSTSASSLNASLRLVPTYRHGDTTSTLNVDLFDLQSSVDMAQAPADAAFDAESSPIQNYSVPTSFSAPLGQDTVALDLPGSWVQEHISALQSNGDVPGFKLVRTSGDIVVGFEHGSATLRVTTNSDTVDFGVQQSFTHIEESSGSLPTLPSGEQLLLDGEGLGLAFNWTNSTKFATLLDSVTVNRAQIRASFDPDIYNNTPTDFVRPAPSDYRILAARRSGGPTCGTLNLFTLDADNNTCLLPVEAAEGPKAARSDRGSTFDTFDRWFSDTRPLDAFRIEIADRNQIPSSPEGTTRRGLPSTIPAVINTDNVRVVFTVTDL